ncbi:MAG: ATP-binding protein [Lachnospiraceae bacterium]|nr:ATP-binding protein [Lachnospiraceae bacterium]
MGKFLNPGNRGFEKIINGYYVDKSGMIALINNRIDTEDSLICVSRPRRFGKSYAAKMLCAYYDHTCDSHKLFDEYEISSDCTYEDNINKYNVIYIDVASFMSEIKRQKNNLTDIANDIAFAVRKELVEDKPELAYIESVSDCLLEYVKLSECRFIFIIDEWDVVIREVKGDRDAQSGYLDLLREWFKNGNLTHEVVAAAYMTGILPIKKDGSQSAISDFKEFSVLEPGEFAKYTGFLEEDVKKICDKYQANFNKMKKWYDGYTVGEVESVYNPYSVLCASKSGKYKSYWRQTSAADNLLSYIEMDEDGLQGDIAQLIAGETIEIDSSSFNNDVTGFKLKDDVLTLLVHLGYLAYEQKVEVFGEGEDEDEIIREFVYIPNDEVRLEFSNILKITKHEVLTELLSASKKLLQDTINGNEEAVAKAIDEIRQMNYAPTYYNNEQALRYVIKFAYIVCVDNYMKIEELPSGKGIADVVFIPRRAVDPVLVIELKWNKTETAAIKQIKDKQYPKILKNQKGNIVLVGINYDEDNKLHSCKIEIVKK